MKKFGVFVIFAFVTLALAASQATAQCVVLYGGPKILVRVVNALPYTSGTAIAVWIDGKEPNPPTLILPSGEWGVNFNFCDIESTVAIDVNVCGSTAPASGALDLPPQWAMEDPRLGSARLTLGILRGYPPMSLLKWQAKEIEKAVRDWPGHKMLQLEVKDWVKRVDKNGLRSSGVVCENPIRLTRTLQLGSGYYNQTITLMVTPTSGSNPPYQIEGGQ